MGGRHPPAKPLQVQASARRFVPPFADGLATTLPVCFDLPQGGNGISSLNGLLGVRLFPFLPFFSFLFLHSPFPRAIFASARVRLVEEKKGAHG